MTRGRSRAQADIEELQQQAPGFRLIENPDAEDCAHTKMALFAYDDGAAKQLFDQLEGMSGARYEL